MAQVKRKFSRKEMKQPDEFLKKSWEFGQWVADHSRQIIIVTVTLLVIILVGTLVWSYSQSQKLKSSTQMQDVFKASAKEVVSTEYSEGQEGKVDDETFGSLFHKNEALLKAYEKARQNAKTDAIRKISTLGVATSLLALERYKQAVKEFESLVANPSGIESMMHVVYEGLGFAYEGLGKYEKALEEFRKIEKVSEGQYKELSLYHQGRILEKQGKKDKATELYSKIAQTIKNASEMTPLYVYLQEKIVDKEGVDLGFSFPGSSGGFGKELTPEMLEELKRKIEEMNSKKTGEKQEEGKPENKNPAGTGEGKEGKEKNQ